MKELNEQEFKEILLSILIKVDKLCRDNDIQYFLFAGTLIGAIRHKGFIPWDDDIDIAMLRSDYDKFVRLFDNNIVDDLRFLDAENNDNYFYPFGKVCDCSTVLIEKDFINPLELGIYVDVFPIDNQGNTVKCAKDLVKKMRWLNAFFFESNLDHFHRISKKWYYEIPKALIYPLAKCGGTRYWSNLMIKTAKKYDGPLTNYVGCNVDPNYHTIMNKEWFACTVDVDFEGHHFMAPIGYTYILELNYGDYMQLPPIDKRKSHHNCDAYMKEW